MIEVTLHPTPRFRDVALEQIRIVGLSLRPFALVVAVVLAIGTVMVVGEILSGGPGFDSRDPYPTALIAFIFPFAVWRSEKRFGPAFLWTLPVERRQLALARVFAGLVWLTGAMAVFISWLLLLALLGRATPEFHIARVPFIATIAAYLFGSALVVGLRHPLRWLFGTAGVLFLIGNLSQALEEFSGWQSLLGSRTLFYAAVDARDLWLTLPDPAQWAITTVLSLGVGLAALWAAASRHRERRRQ